MSQDSSGSYPVLDDQSPASIPFGQCRYRAFGARTDISGIAPARQDPSFQNRTFDAGLGIYDYRNRSFDPATGRFLQRDPVLDEGSLFNPYTGMGNNPVGNVDRYGTIIEFLCAEKEAVEAFLKEHGVAATVSVEDEKNAYGLKSVVVKAKQEDRTGTMEKEIISVLAASDKHTQYFGTLELQQDIKVRKAVVANARKYIRVVSPYLQEVLKPGYNDAAWQEVECWSFQKRNELPFKDDPGVKTKGVALVPAEGVPLSVAVRDIFLTAEERVKAGDELHPAHAYPDVPDGERSLHKGHVYAFECSRAVYAIFYGALLDLMGDDLFDFHFGVKETGKEKATSYGLTTQPFFTGQTMDRPWHRHFPYLPTGDPLGTRLTLPGDHWFAGGQNFIYLGGGESAAPGGLGYDSCPRDEKKLIRKAVPGRGQNVGSINYEGVFGPLKYPKRVE